jgi:hypothetical protein
MIREIAQKDWPAFCQMVSTKYQGTLVDLQMINTRVETIGTDLPLQSLLFDGQSDACNNLLTIATGSLQHQIVEPISFVLRKPTGHEGAEKFHALEIPAESGTTVLTIHPGIASQDLNGL